MNIKPFAFHASDDLNFLQFSPACLSHVSCTTSNIITSCSCLNDGHGSQLYSPLLPESASSCLHLLLTATVTISSSVSIPQTGRSQQLTWEGMIQTIFSWPRTSASLSAVNRPFLEQLTIVDCFTLTQTSTSMPLRLMLLSASSTSFVSSTSSSLIIFWLIKVRSRLSNTLQSLQPSLMASVQYSLEIGCVIHATIHLSCLPYSDFWSAFLKKL